MVGAISLSQPQHLLRVWLHAHAVQPAGTWRKFNDGVVTTIADMDEYLRQPAVQQQAHYVLYKQTVTRRAGSHLG